MLVLRGVDTPLNQRGRKMNVYEIIMFFINVFDISYNSEKDSFELTYKDDLFDYEMIVEHDSDFYDIVKEKYEKRKTK